MTPERRADGLGDLETRLFGIMSGLRGLGGIEETWQSLLALLALRKLLDATPTVGETFADLTQALDVELALKQALHAHAHQGSAPEGLLENIDTLLTPTRSLDRRALTAAVQGVATIPADLLDSRSVARIVPTLVSQGLGKRGELGPPALGVTSLMLELAKPPAGARCADPFCRAGLLLLAAGEWARARRAPVAALDGSDVNQGAVAVARVILFLSDLPNDIDATNVLLSPGKRAQGSYDAVLTAPPFGIPSPPQLHIEGSGRFRFGVPARAADWLFAQHALSLLSENGVAVVLMSRGALFRSGGEESVRRGLVEADQIEAVISLPGGLLPNTNIPCALVVFRRVRAADSRGMITMVDVEEPSKVARRTDLSGDLIASVLAATRGDSPVGGGVHGRRVEKRVLAENDYTLLPSRYFESTPAAATRDLGEIASDLQSARALEGDATRRVAEALSALVASTRSSSHDRSKKGVAP